MNTPPDCLGVDLWTRTQLLGSGAGDHGIRRELADRRLIAVWPGVYVDGKFHDGCGTAARHVLTARGAASTTAGVLSHSSAALVHKLPLWRANLTRVHMTLDRVGGGRVGARRHLHAAPLRACDVVSVAGVPVTSLARTVADLCSTLPFEGAVCTGDAALHLGLTVDEVVDAVATVPRRNPVSVQRAVSFLDGRAESIGESRSRVFLRTFGFPGPALQVSLYTPSGDFLGRPDFLFERDGVIGEFDGKVKYAEYVPKGSTAGEVVFAEKQREDVLRSYGWVVVRWTWSDLAAPHALAERVRRAFRIAAGMPAPSTVCGRTRARSTHP